jgi:hypothetical protein
MAPSGSGSLRDRRTGRWPLVQLAGMRAQTLAALADAPSEPSPPRPHAELTFHEYPPGKSLPTKLALFAVMLRYSVCE